MAKEIERKFLVRHDGWRDLVAETIGLQQAYIASMEDRSVRIRLANGTQATLTVKIGKRMTRDEFEYPIPLADAEELMTKAVGVPIIKTRHKVPYKGFTWEIDVFDGVHAGLQIAEVEMGHEDDNPELPDWLGEEVTGQHRYSNQALAMRSEV
ncbi:MULTISPECIES: CYTH domain-containing protein [unclassified Rhizobium]|uniref:CYTH domain-containing protein n=1 Tax=unclassified Rhizobium TaxID=2613769 RepID=UPI001AD9C518|nr:MULTISPECIES: CYTH domain-containing protein [unclassified Rhizobium]MBO9099795.1 CYTH domain-containing protein [Rhizobium sp. L58/93]MBO9131662.1 CYTH domain-containing protein [Rhizobium sp. B209b/85]MBO9169784.1 CYTH domain-containing protein [Rhizobium sp. L245/93]MBO9185742.1 CYTH domain-containing protein [Rhizobium sp. E27B/91]QXZ82505.1 CYTH domain-containing protein [Rhizobium sp. K1/93]